MASERAMGMGVPRKKCPPRKPAVCQSGSCKTMPSSVLHDSASAIRVAGSWTAATTTFNSAVGKSVRGGGGKSRGRARFFLAAAMQCPIQNRQMVDAHRLTPRLAYFYCLSMELLAHQVEHVRKVHSILDSYRFALDTSKMGLGKTYVACKIAADRGLRLCVVCPVTLISKWQRVAQEWGLLVVTISYARLRGKGSEGAVGGPVGSEWLYRSGRQFLARETFLDMVRDGCLLVGDEAQGLKNSSDQACAFSALCQPIKAAPAGSGSRILLLSATPFDKQGHVMNLLQIALVSASRDMYHYFKDSFGAGALLLTGAHEVVTACRRHDSVATDRIMRTMPRSTAAHIPRLLYTLFIDILAPHVSTYMVTPTAEALPPPAVRSAFYHISGALLEQYMSGVSQLHKSVDLLEEGGDPPDWRGITYGLQTIELAKCDAVARHAARVLSEHPAAKVIIGLNYHASISTVVAALRGAHPVLVLTGQVKQEARAPLLDRFQASNTEHRLLVCNMAVMEVGIDLDDKDGGFPRTCLYSPHYRATGLHQAIGRVHRTDTRSSATVHIVYGPRECAESSVLAALTRKTRILKETLPGQVADGTVFPGDYTILEVDVAGEESRQPVEAEEQADPKRQKSEE